MAKTKFWHLPTFPEERVPSQRKPKRDAAVIAIEKAYRASNQYQLDKLLHLHKRFRLRLTLAQAGLDRTQKQIQDLLVRISKDRMGDRHP